MPTPTFLTTPVQIEDAEGVRVGRAVVREVLLFDQTEFTRQIALLDAAITARQAELTAAQAELQTLQALRNDIQNKFQTGQFRTDVGTEPAYVTTAVEIRNSSGVRQGRYVVQERLLYDVPAFQREVDLAQAKIAAAQRAWAEAQASRAELIAMRDWAIAEFQGGRARIEIQ